MKLRYYNKYFIIFLSNFQSYNEFAYLRESKPPPREKGSVFVLFIVYPGDCQKVSSMFVVVMFTAVTYDEINNILLSMVNTPKIINKYKIHKNACMFLGSVGCT